jgi:uncharacterized protein YfaP (DUF2135 family)
MGEGNSPRPKSPWSAQTRLGRRRLLETLTAASSAIAAAALLHRRPLGFASAQSHDDPVRAHEATDLRVTLTWDTDDTDLDLFVIAPCGSVVCWHQMAGAGATLDADNTEGRGPETVCVAPGGAASGVYHVYVGYYRGKAPTTATIRITTLAGRPGAQTATFTRLLESGDYNERVYEVADVAFPGGVVTERAQVLPYARWSSDVADLLCD